jgi:hypothetical protein
MRTSGSTVAGQLVLDHGNRLQPGESASRQDQPQQTHNLPDAQRDPPFAHLVRVVVTNTAASRQSVTW